jgi:hydrogenase nickel incorporation protein HypB
MLKAIESLDLQNLDVLLIEAIGEAEGGVPDLGHDATAALFAASGGDDKAAECAALVAAADVILLSKMNLLPHVSFDRELFEADVLQANPSAERIDIDVDDADSLQRWTQWLTRQGLCKRLGAQSRSGEQIRPEFFVG